ncbi:hypothetical protein [Amycolatopsis sp. NPDC054798]
MSDVSAPPEPPGFSIFLPDGFIALPSGEIDEEKFRSLAASVSAEFGAEPDAEIDQGIAETTAMLATTAAMAEAGGSSYTAAGFFRSPDDPRRPIMAVVNCFCLESDHSSATVAISGLEEVQRSTATGPVEVVELPAGPAVIAQSATRGSISIGEGSVQVAEHAITAWIPGPKVVLGLAVTSNNPEDWTHVTDLARGIFDTFEWADAD